ncbi:MAG: hydantoinase/oxoprolinase family protein [Pseudomonadota bacterium]
MPTEAVLGWDVGGAHLKAACLDGAGRVDRVWQEACPLWRGLDHLDRALDRILGELAAPPAQHGVTMTGEMTDLFADRKSGVQSLVDRLCHRLGAEKVRFYAGPEGWLNAGSARLRPQWVASANWHASAALVAARLGEGLLVDVGSTTCDLIPIRGRQVATASEGDAERLAAGELVYGGVVRTPLMALADGAPVQGRWLPLMAEHFATSADVYRILGWLPEHADLQDSADGGPKTVAASRTRLARMVGRDAAELPEAAWTELAAWFADAQLTRMARAARQVLSRTLLRADAPLVTAGTGAFLGERLAARLGRPTLAFPALLGEHADPEQSGWCAPAIAVGWLLREDRP